MVTYLEPDPYKLPEQQSIPISSKFLSLKYVPTQTIDKLQ